MAFHTFYHRYTTDVYTIRQPRDYLLEFALHSSHIPVKYPSVSWNAVLQLAGRQRYRANNGHFVYVTAAADEKQTGC